MSYVKSFAVKITETFLPKPPTPKKPTTAAKNEPATPEKKRNVKAQEKQSSASKKQPMGDKAFKKFLEDV